MSEEQEKIEKVLNDKKDVRNVILDELEEGDKGRRFEKVEKLNDVELPVRVEFARIEKTIQQILDLCEGDLVKLNRFAGELVDIFVGNRLFAKGEITVVDDKFGVRVVEIFPSVEEI